MDNGPYFPLFCTTNASPDIINETLTAAALEEQKDARRKNSWVLVQLKEQTIFPMPTPLVQRFESEFVEAGVNELGSFCKTRFERTGLICNEDFGIIDKRSLADKTILFVRWEQYTPEDDVILRIMWGEATPDDEAWLDKQIKTPEDLALFRKAQGKATRSDESLIQRAKEEVLGDDRNTLSIVQEAQEEAISREDDPRSDATQPDKTFLEAVEAESKAEPKSDAKVKAKEETQPDVEGGAEQDPKPDTKQKSSDEQKPEVKTKSSDQAPPPPYEAVQRDPAQQSPQPPKAESRSSKEVKDSDSSSAKSPTQKIKRSYPAQPVHHINVAQAAIAGQAPLTPSVKRTSRAFDMAEMANQLALPGSSSEKDSKEVQDNDKVEPDENRIEILEGWRMMRVPIESAMRDTDLIFRRSITDLLKIRSLFDKFGVLRY